MKAWHTLLGFGACSLLVVGCTISTDSTLGDDDDVPIDDDSGSSMTPDEQDAASDVVADAMPADTSPDADMSSDADTKPMTMDSGQPLMPIMCDPGAEDECEACLQNFCCTERQDCSVSDSCMEDWTKFRSCVVDAELATNLDNATLPAGGIPQILDDCESEAGGDDGFDLDAKALSSCHRTQRDMFMGTPLDPDADEGGEPDDSLCGFACYEVFDLTSMNP